MYAKVKPITIASATHIGRESTLISTSAIPVTISTRKLTWSRLITAKNRVSRRSP
jgi:hypothetical protein